MVRVGSSSSIINMFATHSPLFEPLLFPLSFLQTLTLLVQAL